LNLAARIRQVDGVPAEHLADRAALAKAGAVEQTAQASAATDDAETDFRIAGAVYSLALDDPEVQ
jgi:hypothetical protein